MFSYKVGLLNKPIFFVLVGNTLFTLISRKKGVRGLTNVLRVIITGGTEVTLSQVFRNL